MIILILLSLSGAPMERAEKCELVYEFAKVFMTARQSGMELPEVMRRIDSVEGIDALKSPLSSLAIDAYSKPAYQSKHYKQKAIMDFSNQYYALCLKR